MNKWWQLTRALIYRAWIQQKITTVVVALALGVMMGVMCVLDGAAVGTKQTPPAEMIAVVQNVAELRGADGEIKALNSVLIMQMPALIALLVAVVATMILPGVVADDTEGSGLEVMLASGVPRRQLFAAYLAAGAALTLMGFVALLLGFIGAFLASVMVGGMSFSARSAWWIGVFVFPLATGLWSASATLAGALLYPAGLESKAGLNGGWVRVVALLPVILLAAPLAFYGTQHPWLYFVAAVISLLLSWGAISVVSRGFRTAKILRS
ncbi:MAG: hypothetical protein Q4F02_01630 [Candidatus Saccharibacteria bacterium]|nr:hypothetical protein [Candidatus Saccharibacteria bacterium]